MTATHPFQPQTEWRNVRTGVTFRVLETFLSGGEPIVNAIIIAGPHSVGCHFQRTLSGRGDLVPADTEA